MSHEIELKIETLHVADITTAIHDCNSYSTFPKNKDQSVILVNQIPGLRWRSWNSIREPYNGYREPLFQ